MNGELRDCLTACLACGEECRSAAAAVVAVGRPPNGRLLRMLFCCEELCALCADLCRSDAVDCPDAFAACAEACLRCAGECQRSGEPSARQCLVECVRAAERCRRCFSIAA